MKEINEVKRELRELKKYTHAIKQIESARKTHLMRIKLLEGMQENDRILALIEKENTLLADQTPINLIESACEIEERYKKAINELPILERGIIVDAFINGTPYWKIGLEIGYSEDGVRKKVSKIISKIAKSI